MGDSGLRGGDDKGHTEPLAWGESVMDLGMEGTHPVLRVAVVQGVLQVEKDGRVAHREFVEEKGRLQRASGGCNEFGLLKVRHVRPSS